MEKWSRSVTKHDGKTRDGNNKFDGDVGKKITSICTKHWQLGCNFTKWFCPA